MLHLGTPDELTLVKRNKVLKFSMGGGILHQINSLNYVYEEFTFELERIAEDIFNGSGQSPNSGRIYTRSHAEPVVYQSRTSEAPSMTVDTSTAESWYTWTSSFGEIRVQRDVNLDPYVLTDSTTLAPYTTTCDTGTSGVAVSDNSTYANTLVTASSQ